MNGKHYRKREDSFEALPGRIKLCKIMKGVKGDDLYYLISNLTDCGIFHTTGEVTGDEFSQYRIFRRAKRFDRK